MPVAGVGALLIAKVHKIAERVERGRHGRTPVDKDAGDVFRLTQATAVADMAFALKLAIAEDVSRPPTESGLQRLQELFGRSAAPGVQMAIRAIGPAGDEPGTTETVIVGYVSALLSAL